MKKKLFFIAVILLAAGGAFCLFQIKHFAASQLTIHEDTIFTLPAGTGREGLKTALRQQHIVKRTRWLTGLWIVEPELANFKAGTYRFTPGMTVRQMLALLVSGREAQFSIRFVEGSTLQEWLAILDKAPYLEHSLRNVSIDQLAGRLARDGDTVVQLESNALRDRRKLMWNGAAAATLVVDGKGDRTCALMGSIMINACKKAGLSGVVLDGAHRDTEELRELGFPVYSTGPNPNGPTKFIPGRINWPVSCGGVAIHPGDLVVGDADGVVVVEREKAGSLLDAAAKKVAEPMRSSFLAAM